jgi:membrane-associated phospholipid phosphatase
LVPDKFATAALANIALLIAPLAIEVTLPVLVTTPVKFAFVLTVAAFPPIFKPLAVPVILVPTKVDGVPKAGLTSVGEVLMTTFPVPVISFDTIFLLASYHYLIHNDLEKTISKTYFEYNDIRRPLNKCNTEINSSRLSCTGMPSGHAETISIICILLYLYNFIPLWLSIIIIMIVSFQRIISNKHTLIQVLIGSLLGLIYATIYKFSNLSIYGFIFVLGIGFILTMININKID